MKTKLLLAACLPFLVILWFSRSEPAGEAPLTSGKVSTKSPVSVLPSPQATPEVVTPRASPSTPSGPLHMLAVFSTPITFYGRVLDQNGEPVPEAQVSANASTSMGGNSTKITAIADASGNFAIHSKGMSLFVSVDKAGYYHVFPGQNPTLVSEKVFDFGNDSGRGIHKADQNQPVVLQLFKPGIIEPLIRLKSTSQRLNRSGTPVEVALDPALGGRHKVALSCKADGNTASDGRFSWRFDVRVIAGGLVADSSTFQFEAPEIGYQRSAAVDMPQALPRPQWQDSTRQSYFVRFDDNTYGRVKVEMIAFGDFFSVIESYYNPKPGSRNIGADPSKR